jgi:3-hydroxyacyl-CoA dehydrogenase
MVDEGARLLAEGMADSAAAIDLVQALGFGYPRRRGGPMWRAAAEGLRAVVDRLDARRAAGEGPGASDALRRLAEGAAPA